MYFNKLNFKIINKLFLLFLCFVFFNINYSIYNPQEYTQEYIDNLDIYIKINKDRTADIKTKINYFLPNSGRHGISYHFPVRYKDKLGNNINARFTVNSILKNGIHEEYKLLDEDNFKIVQIGDPNKYVSGNQIYEINTTIDGYLAFFSKDKSRSNNQNNNFDNWVEFYYRVIPELHPDIKKTIVKLELPEGIKKEDVSFKAYMGTLGNLKSENYIASIENIDDINIIEFNLTKLLAKGQIFTIFVYWPQFYLDPCVDNKMVQDKPIKPIDNKESCYVERFTVNPISTYERLSKFLKDNLYIGILLSGLVIICVYYIFKIREFKSSIKKGTIIPLFYPPKDMPASAVGCLYIYNYSKKINKLFAAEIVNMAVHNLLKINYKKGSLLSPATYTISKNSEFGSIDDNNQVNKIHKSILNTLFNNNDKIEINKKNNRIILRASKKLNDYLKAYYEDIYFDYHTSTAVKAIVFGFVTLLFSLYLNKTFISIIFIIIYVIVISILSYISSGYTQQGQKLLEDILGFRKFLSTTESERLKTIGTPPEKTPELYEKYLPYAMVLGVEKAWSEKFASVFNKIENYNPAWTNLNARLLSQINISSGLSSALSSAITPSAIYKNMPAPGSISGLEDDGKSGGSGGGGIESW